MDWMNSANSAMTFVRKYRYAFLVVAAGVLLMLSGKDTAPAPDLTPDHVPAASPALEDSLARILSLVDGAGEVKVLLTPAAGEEILYQTDTDMAAGDSRTDTVLISGSDRTESGLVRQINPPKYKGAIILCQGADSPGIRLAIVEAVMDVTGLTSDKITVLKMK